MAAQTGLATAEELSNMPDDGYYAVPGWMLPVRDVLS